MKAYPYRTKFGKDGNCASNLGICDKGMGSTVKGGNCSDKVACTPMDSEGSSGTTYSPDTSKCATGMACTSGAGRVTNGLNC